MVSPSSPLIAALFVVMTSVAFAAEPDTLIAARMSYNLADYDAAIAAAAEARLDAEWADPAALVLARALLERFRLAGNPADLTAAHEALVSVMAPELSPRDYVDLLVGLGQYLFLTDSFGAARALFDGALAQSYLMSGRDRLLLLDWWANALDRSAHARPLEARAPLFRELATGMEDELRRDPGNPVANYWLPVAARGAGDVERAWDAARAGWVRATLDRSATVTLRTDLDRYVSEVLIPALSRARGGRAPDGTLTAIREEWERFKADWP